MSSPVANLLVRVLTLTRGPVKADQPPRRSKAEKVAHVFTGTPCTHFIRGATPETYAESRKGADLHKWNNQK